MHDITVVHSSDLHINTDRATDRFHPLCRVLATAQRLEADVLLLAGDVFDHNRLPLTLLDSTSRLLSDATFPIVILPGNHDCITHDSVYRRGGIEDVPNVHVIGVSVDQAVVFPHLDLEVWGHAHFDYKNMSPLASPRPRTTRRQIAMAHGHWARESADRHRGWLISNDDIASTIADYVALGHWPQALAAGDGVVPAYYSGSPDLAATVNVVRFTFAGAVTVSRAELNSHSAG
jgi:DNA repair exonuclease SbcCD nuclease subunit